MNIILSKLIRSAGLAGSLLMLATASQPNQIILILSQKNGPKPTITITVLPATALVVLEMVRWRVSLKRSQLT